MFRWEKEFVPHGTWCRILPWPAARGDLRRLLRAGDGGRGRADGPNLARVDKRRLATRYRLGRAAVNAHRRAVGPVPPRGEGLVPNDPALAADDPAKLLILPIASNHFLRRRQPLSVGPRHRPNLRRAANENRLLAAPSHTAARVPTALAVCPVDPAPAATVRAVNAALRRG